MKEKKINSDAGDLLDLMDQIEDILEKKSIWYRIKRRTLLKFGKRLNVYKVLEEAKRALKYKPDWPAL